MGLFDSIKDAATKSGTDLLHTAGEQAYDGVLNAAGVGTGAAGVSPQVNNAAKTPATAQNGTQASPTAPMSFLAHPADFIGYIKANPVKGIAVLVVLGAIGWYAYKKFA